MKINNIYDITENKLILLFIIKKSALALTNAQITELVMRDSLMNYFLLQQYLAELISTGQILLKTKDDKQVHVLTNRGLQSLEYFELKIPQIIKEKVLESISFTKDEFKRADEVISTYSQLPKNGYLVECKVIEYGEPLIELKFTVGSKIEAKKICNYWKGNSVQLYPKIISLFTLNNDKKRL